MNIEAARRFFKGTKIRKSDLQFISFCKNAIDSVGYICVNVVYKNYNFENLHLYLTSVDREPIVGSEWIHEFCKVDLKLRETMESIKCVINKITVVPKDTDEQVNRLISKYSNIVSDELSPIKNFEAKLHLKQGAKPIFIKARQVPFSVMPLVEAELDFLVANDILEKVDTSEFATPIVPVLKKNNRVRICGDFSVTVNKLIEKDEHPLSTIEKLLIKLSGGLYFSKIDLKQAFLQMKVDAESSKLLTLSTHRGLYRAKRLMPGVESGPANWQRYIESLLADLNVSVLLDDIVYSSATPEEHLRKTEQVLKRLSVNNIKINLEKCEFFKFSVHYCGYIIDKDGVHKDPEKVEAMKNMPAPRNVSELRSFIGFVNYYGRFIKNLSTILKPLHDLLHKEANFVWSESCQKAFTKAKAAFTSDNFMAHYDPKLPLVLSCDASPHGVGAVLSHIYPDNTERPIIYVSHTLNSVQRRYSQIDKEALAIVYSVKRLYQYLYHRKFTLFCDCKPLVHIFDRSKSLPVYSAMRMQHYAIFLQGFNFDIKYRKSEHNCNADCLPHLPLQELSRKRDVLDVFLYNASYL